MAHTYAKHAGSACVSMPPHADTPSDLKQARHASYKTQIVAEGQKRGDLASVAQTKISGETRYLATARIARLSRQAAR